MITLLTDFDLGDSYVAEMKAVILFICSEANIVGTSHNMQKYDARMGVYLLARASRYFPNGTTTRNDRRPWSWERGMLIIVKNQKKAFYVGPDNGC